MDDKQSQMNYVLVTGGVISGVGKGIVSSSIGTILRSCGFHVTCIKVDPYLNIDAGTFSPYEHGEVYVLDDGAEVDLDLGNYERYLDIVLKRDNNITTGRVYQRVIQKERAGDYLGKTVQVVPHVTDEIKLWINTIAHVPTDGSGAIPNICIIELGGVISDIESLPFVEAFRQLLVDVGHNHFCCVHVSPIPRISSELKTKPTQSSVWELRNKGLQADILMSRSTVNLPEEIIQKLSRMCHVKKSHIFNIPDVPNLYQVPKMMADLEIDKMLIDHFNLSPRPKLMPCLLDRWTEMLQRASHTKNLCHVAIVGKYTLLKDSYVSIIKAIEHAAAELGCEPVIEMVNSSHLESSPISGSEFLEAWKTLTQSDCVIIPGGFGTRGIEGKLIAIQYCRQFGVPILGICLGFQLMVIEFCRNVLNWKSAHSTEINPKCDPRVIIDMPEHNNGEYGGTMRLGIHTTKVALSNSALKFAVQNRVFQAGSKRPSDDYSSSIPKKCTYNGDSCNGGADVEFSKILKLLGGKNEFDGRHRHRYEVNPAYIDKLEDAGFAFVGRDSSGKRMEIGELLLPFTNSENLKNHIFPRETLNSTVMDVDLKKKLEQAWEKTDLISKECMHPFYVGTQFHPEYLSRPTRPCQLFLNLLKISMKIKH